MVLFFWRRGGQQKYIVFKIVLLGVSHFYQIADLQRELETRSSDQRDLQASLQSVSSSNCDLRAALEAVRSEVKWRNEQVAELQGERFVSIAYSVFYYWNRP